MLRLTKVLARIKYREEISNPLPITPFSEIVEIVRPLESLLQSSALLVERSLTGERIFYLVECSDRQLSPSAELLTELLLTDPLCCLEATCLKKRRAEVHRPTPDDIFEELRRLKGLEANISI